MLFPRIDTSYFQIYHFVNLVLSKSEGVFQRTFQCGPAVSHVCFMVSEVQVARSFVTPHMRAYSTILLGCQFPKKGWVKVNVGSSVHSSTLRATYGWVMRDASGSWLGGFCMKLGVCSVLMVELQGILNALRVSWDSDHRRIWLESDS